MRGGVFGEIPLIREIIISLLQKKHFRPKVDFFGNFPKRFGRGPIAFGFFYGSRIHLQNGEKSAEHEFEKNTIVIKKLDFRGMINIFPTNLTIEILRWQLDDQKPVPVL